MNATLAYTEFAMSFIATVENEVADLIHKVALVGDADDYRYTCMQLESIETRLSTVKRLMSYIDHDDECISEVLDDMIAIWQDKLNLEKAELLAIKSTRDSIVKDNPVTLAEVTKE